MEELHQRKSTPWKKKCLSWSVRQIKQRIPIVEWLPKYKWKTDFVPDLIAGVTVMFINVPQGLAFSVLANVDLMYGLYTSCFSSFLYTFLGTAHISSFGPVAVGSMLTGEAVSKVMELGYKPNEIAVTITFVIGAWYLIGFILRLGIISMIFRKPFVSGFITACALHVLAKSVKMILGMRTPHQSGVLSFFYNLYGLYENYNLINYPTVITSAIIIFILILNTVVLRHILAKYTKFVIPIEAVVMLVAILLSYYLNFEEMGMSIVGDVPTGFPTPAFPKFYLINNVWGEALVVAVVNYSTTISMVLLFNKDLDSDQELLAMAFVNFVCSNLQCLTIGNSMMRTVIAVNVGLKTLVTTMVSSVLLLFVILYGGPLFQPLPSCVLGCIIIVSAGQLLLQRLMEVKSIWHSSIENGLIWGTSLAAGLIVELQVGMVVGAALSLRQILVEKNATDKLENRTLTEQGNIENGKMTIEEPERDNLLEKGSDRNAKIV